MRDGVWMRIVRSRNVIAAGSITLITELQVLVRTKLARPNLSIQLCNSSQHRCYAQRTHLSVHHHPCRSTNCRTSAQCNRSHACIRHHRRPQSPHLATSPARPALQPDQAPNCAPQAFPEIYLHPVSNRFFLTIHTEPRSQLLFRLEQSVIDGTVCIFISKSTVIECALAVPAGDAPMKNACNRPQKERWESCKASMRAQVGHSFRVIKRELGYTEVRYRGLTRNSAHVLTLRCPTCG